MQQGNLSTDYGTRKLTTKNIIDHLNHMMDIYQDANNTAEKHPTNLFNQKLIAMMAQMN